MMWTGAPHISPIKYLKKIKIKVISILFPILLTHRQLFGAVASSEPTSPLARAARHAHLSWHARTPGPELTTLAPVWRRSSRRTLAEELEEEGGEQERDEGGRGT
jgi:hypothetical protein